MWQRLLGASQAVRPRQLIARLRGWLGARQARAARASPPPQTTPDQRACRDARGTNGQVLCAHVDGLADAVRARSVHIAATAQLSARLAHGSFAAARAVVAMEEQLDEAEAALAALEALFARAGAIADQPVPAVPGGQLQALSRAGAAALASLRQDVSRLRAEGEAAGRHCHAIAGAVAAHNDRADQLAAAVSLQNAHVAELVRLAAAGRAGGGRPGHGIPSPASPPGGGAAPCDPIRLVPDHGDHHREGHHHGDTQHSDAQYLDAQHVDTRHGHAPNGMTV